MKKTILPILLVTAVLFSLQCCVSCSPTDSDVEEEENQAPEKPHLDPGTYQFIASPIKGSWEEGDKIYVHGSYGQAAVTITLGKAEYRPMVKPHRWNLEKILRIFMPTLTASMPHGLQKP